MVLVGYGSHRGSDLEPCIHAYLYDTHIQDKIGVFGNTITDAETKRSDIDICKGPGGHSRDEVLSFSTGKPRLSAGFPFSSTTLLSKVGRIGFCSRESNCPRSNPSRFAHEQLLWRLCREGYGAPRAKSSRAHDRRGYEPRLPDILPHRYTALRKVCQSQ